LCHWLDGLARAGVTFEGVGTVINTHPHVDHCGWNTRLINGRWVPTLA
jgi:glyoxylase-like metal-dependent hydrolase (beta-lactamase superfamily II)